MGFLDSYGREEQKKNQSKITTTAIATVTFLVIDEKKEIHGFKQMYPSIHLNEDFTNLSPITTWPNGKFNAAPKFCPKSSFLG
jgi:hypothetical protein